MFHDLIATAPSEADSDHRSSSSRGSRGCGGALPRTSSTNHSRASSTEVVGTRHRRSPSAALADDGDEDYPLVSSPSPLIGTAYTSPGTDGRQRRPGSSAFQSPYTPTGGNASSATAMASPSAGLPAAVSSVPPLNSGGRGSSGPSTRCVTTVADTSSGSYHGDSVGSSLSSTPTPSRTIPLHKAAGASSSPPAPPSPDEDVAAPSAAATSSSAAAAAAAAAAARGAARDGHTRSLSPPSSSSSSSSSTSSAPCAAPMEEPPGSAMKPPAGSVVVLGVAEHAPAHPLHFSVAYVEEEHRVRLETHETEERRCLYRAHRAVLSLYRMWAADGVDVGDYGDRDGSPARLPEDRPRAIASSPAVATERVRSFLTSSIDSARSRRDGAAAVVRRVEASSAQMRWPVAHEVDDTVASETVDGERRASPGVRPHPRPLQTSHVSSPAASRALEYSSVQVPELAPSLLYGSSEAPSSLHHTHRLFSPWRPPRSGPHDGSARHTERTAADTHTGGGRHVASRASLIPHIVSAPATPAATPASYSISASQLPSSAAVSWRRGPPASRSVVDGTDSLRGASRAVTPPASSAEAVSPSWLRGAAAVSLDGRERSSAGATELRDVSQTAAAAPDWNASAHLQSTSAASRHISPTREVACGASVGEQAWESAAPYASNAAFRLRQLATVSGLTRVDPRRSPRGDTAADQRTLSVTPPRRVAAPRQDEYRGYVPYKRVFDAAYALRGTSPPASARGLEGRRTNGGGGHSARWRTGPAPVSTVRAADGDAADGAAHPWRRPSPTSSLALARARSPRPGLRNDVRGLSPRSPNVAALSTPPTASVVLRGAPAPSHTLPSTALADAALLAARSTRLTTLEKLCRAELQRRWMEDRNVLLHHFIMEGTAALQRSRRSTHVSTAIGSRVGGGLRAAPAWVFIPNEAGHA
ncbi:hypothetical protein NESM_000609300 [Novymonas esmeraldas]|uniref:Uncharacterized protein n=1 Tax=Novymonas esmeraldas TaxID=1808958 RepID=A0AAW0ET65_9TRYP